LGLSAVPAFAIDPPHVTANLCSSCHIPHLALGGDLTSVAGNANLCISCHQSGGTASTKPFADIDQALPWPGSPAGVSASGTSHRWDAGAAGHLVFLGGAGTPSTGTLVPSGTFTGPYAKTYTITISSAGAVGTARFNWAATAPGGGAGSSVLTGANVPLDQGVFLSFLGGTGPSFQVGDQWNLYVRCDLRQPTNSILLAHTVNGIASCSACHDEHSQARTPFDPAAPAYGGSGTGNGRHFMRVDNNLHQMCNDCHATRVVTTSLAGSHPVGITVPVDGLHQAPTQQPLETGSAEVVCLTCHRVHNSPRGDGRLLRITSSVAACVDCHTQSDTATPAAHMAATNSATLWPGGRFGSLMPARTNPADQGTCLNCHAVHGWPDAANPANHYAKLLADFEENLCYTCHGTSGPAVKQVQLDFAKTSYHPVANSQQVAGRKVECLSCHNPHIAQSGGWVYANTATATRNQISKPLLGVSGVAVNYTGLGNFVAPAP
jgi:predicted CXXCH cytochrome family protein